jgi:hypothetical protein
MEKCSPAGRRSELSTCYISAGGIYHNKTHSTTKSVLDRRSHSNALRTGDGIPYFITDTNTHIATDSNSDNVADPYIHCTANSNDFGVTDTYSHGCPKGRKFLNADTGSHGHTSDWE